MKLNPREIFSWFFHEDPPKNMVLEPHENKLIQDALIQETVGLSFFYEGKSALKIIFNTLPHIHSEIFFIELLKNQYRIQMSTLSPQIAFYESYTLGMKSFQIPQKKPWVPQTAILHPSILEQKDFLTQLHIPFLFTGQAIPQILVLPVERIVLVVDPSLSLEQTTVLGESIHTFLKSLKAPLSIEWIHSPIPPERFHEFIQTRSIVHFIGHIEERGLHLGDDFFYHPSHFPSTQGSAFLILDACTLSRDQILSFADLSLPAMIFSPVDRLDSSQSSETWFHFYLGLLLGYPLGILDKILRKEHLSTFGYALTQVKI